MSLAEKIMEQLAEKLSTDGPNSKTFLDAFLQISQVNSRKEFNKARADLAEELPKIVKDASGHNYKYAELSEILETIKPILAKHGFYVRWTCHTGEAKITVKCHLTHRDGWEDGAELSAMADQTGGKNAVQAVGSVVSYLKRYTLEMTLGIAASKDDDGAAAGQQSQRPKPAPQEHPAMATLTDVQVSELRKILEQFQDQKAVLDSMLTYVRGKSSAPIRELADIPRILANELFTGLTNKLEAEKKEQAAAARAFNNEADTDFLK